MIGWNSGRWYTGQNVQLDQTSSVSFRGTQSGLRSTWHTGVDLGNTMSAAGIRGGTWALWALLALRLTVGWHFFKEGSKKLRDPDFSAGPFLQEATGPWAANYRGLIRDPFERNMLDESAVLNAWDKLRDETEKRWGSPSRNQPQLDRVVEEWRKRLGSYFADHREELREYFAKADQTAAAWSDPRRQSLNFEREWAKRRAADLRETRSPWVAEIKQMTTAFERELRKTAGDPRPDEPSSITPNRKSWVEHTVTWTTLLVGGALLTGLAVRWASLVGMGFLVTISASQPFWAEGANVNYGYYQAVELAALAVLAATSAGRFAGLDFFWTAYRARREHSR
ncbi:MAG TPA: hypothetical protein VIY86_13425 [Pirellulaceae bacterium]